MNGFSWLSFFFSVILSWNVGEYTCFFQVDKKTLEALVNTLTGRVPEKYQKDVVVPILLLYKGMEIPIIRNFWETEEKLLQG